MVGTRFALGVLLAAALGGLVWLFWPPGSDPGGVGRSPLEPAESAGSANPGRRVPNELAERVGGRRAGRESSESERASEGQPVNDGPRAARDPGAGSIAGRVLDRAGASVADAEVELVWWAGSVRVARTRSGKAGAFRLSCPAGIACGLMARAGGRVATLDGVRSSARPVELRLGDPLRVEVVARDRFSGAVVEPATVRARMLFGNCWLWVKAEEAPNGALFLLPPGRPLRVDVTADGFADWDSGRLESAAAQVVAELVPDLIVHGRVVQAGEPVAGARVRLLEADAAFPGGLEERVQGADFGDGARVTRDLLPERAERSALETRSGADGAFTFAAPDPHGRYRLEARADGRGTGRLEPVEARPDGSFAAVQIDLNSAPAVLRGRVLPFAGLELEELALRLSSRRDFLTPIEPSGAFRAEDLPPGPCVVELVPRAATRRLLSIGHARLAAVPSRRVVLAAGATTELAFDLRAPAACQLRGEVRWGQPAHAIAGVPAAELQWPNRRPVCAVEVDAAGRFVLAAPEPGEYWLVLNAAVGTRGRRTLVDRVRLAAGGQDWSYELPAGELRVLRPEADGGTDPSRITVGGSGGAALRVYAQYPELDPVSGHATFFGLPLGVNVLFEGDESAGYRRVGSAAVRLGARADVRLP